MSELKTIIDANIKENGNQEITGKTLNYVLNTIAEGTQKDWNEFDPTSVSFIKNKTHGFQKMWELISEKSLQDLGMVPDTWFTFTDFSPSVGDIFSLYVISEEYLNHPEPYSLREINVSEGVRVRFYNYRSELRLRLWDNALQLKCDNILDTKISILWGVVAELNHNFIPDTIARTEQVDELREETTALWENLDHGVFPDLVAGDLAGRGESVPAEFGFRASGGKSIKDGRAYIKRIKGNSVVWNQLRDVANKLFTTTKANITLELTQGSNIIKLSGIHDGTTGDLNFYITAAFPSIAGVVGHKYLCTIRGNKNIEMTVFGAVNPAIIVTSSSIVTCSTEGTINLVPRIMDSLAEGAEINEEVSFYCTDLTQMFGAGNEPTTIEEFYARVATLGIDMNAYNEGEVIHCNTESIKSVGDNAWDEEWIAGRLNTDTGQPNLGNIGIISKNYIRVLPNETYYCGYNAAPIFAMFYDAEYALITGVNGSNNFVSIRNTQFTTPANAAYMKFYVADNNLATYNNDICIRLAHSGYKTDYEPYWQDTLPLPIIRKYFPDGMKKAGTAHDEIRYNKVTQKWEMVVRIGEVDMGTLNWAKSGTYTNGYYALPLSGAKPLQYPICRLYSAVNVSSQQDKSIYVGNNGGRAQLFVIDSAYTDVASFKAAMAGVMLYYELAEPIVTELDAEDQNFRDYYNVADFGTEEAIPATDAEGNIIPSAAFSADIIYQFNAVDMIREHEIEITELQKVIATMQAQLASLTNS